MFSSIVFTSLISSLVPVQSFVVFSLKYRTENKERADCELVVTRNKKNFLEVVENRGCSFSNTEIISREGFDTLAISYDVPEDEKYFSAEFQYSIDSGSLAGDQGLTIFSTGPKNNLETSIPLPSLSIGESTLVKVPCWTLTDQIVSSKLVGVIDTDEIQKTTHAWALWRIFWPLYQRASDKQVKVAKLENSSLTLDAVLQPRKVDSCINQSVK